MTEFETYLAKQLAEPAIPIDVTSRVRRHIRRSRSWRLIIVFGIGAIVVTLAGLVLTIGFEAVRGVLPATDADVRVDWLLWLPLAATAALLVLIANEILGLLTGASRSPFDLNSIVARE